jgi:hypothetical protein
MSTYYYFHCTAHQQSGGNFTRQAWGYGNADLIDTFKFVMYHVSECGPENIGMHSEHDANEYTSTGCDNPGARREFLAATAHIFPRSNDWKFMEEHRADARQEWIAAELGEIGDA